MPRRLLPDAVRVVITHLATDPDVMALVADRVVPKLPPNNVSATLVVQRIAGSASPQAKRHLDSPMIQVDAWGYTPADLLSDEAAWRLAETARQAMFAMEGKQLSGAVVAEVSEVTGLSQFDDPESGRPRWTFRHQVRLHPA